MALPERRPLTVHSVELMELGRPGLLMSPADNSWRIHCLVLLPSPPHLSVLDGPL